VNEAVWDWYTLCRKSNIPVSGAMLQEEAMIIAEKLEMNDFVACNGWLDRFKRQHNICNMAVAGEAGNVSTETVESWNERARGSPGDERQNGRLRGRNRQIWLFMDNAPCHPESLEGKFSNINVVFLQIPLPRLSPLMLVSLLAGKSCTESEC